MLGPAGGIVARLAPAGSLGLVHQSGEPPEWMMGPAARVLDDLHGARPIPGLQIVASPIDGLNGLTLYVRQSSRASGELAQLPDDLDPDEPTDYGGGNWVPRSLTGPGLLVLIAEILQEDLAETAVAWGQARPPCPNHPHPARPGVLDGEAWWICERDQKALYRIGQREVPTRLEPPLTWRKESRRARKRRHR